jgi:hypothetical protein
MDCREQPESTAAWTEEQYEEDSLGVQGEDEDDKWHYTNWPDY